MARKWEIVCASLRRRIQDLSPGDRLPSVLALRQEFGVSQHSVCRALDTLERDGLLVKRPRGGIRVAEPPKKHSSPVRLAYAAAGLRDDSVNGATFSHPYFHPLMQTIARAFNQPGYEAALYLFSHPGIEGSRDALERDIANGRIQGLIISPSYLAPCDPDFLLRHGVRTVLIGGEYSGSGFPAVMINSVKKGLLAAQAVSRLGRSPVALITGRSLSSEVEAFLMACEEDGRSVSDACRIHCPANFQVPDQAIAEGREAAAYLVSLAERPQVVWITDDMAAMGVLQVLHDADVHVPRDMAVVVSTSTACVFTHPVVRIAVDPEAVGNLATQTLFALIRGTPIPRKAMYLDPVLIDVPERFATSTCAEEKRAIRANA